MTTTDETQKNATPAIDPNAAANGHALKGLTEAEGEPLADAPAEAGKDKAAKNRPALGLPAQRGALYEKVKTELAGNSLHDEEIQYELARWVELLDISTDELTLPWKARRQAGSQKTAKEALVQRLVRKAGAAIDALISDKPELVFARTLRIRAEMHLLRCNGLMSRGLIALTDGSPTMIVGLGALSAFAGGLIANLMWPWLQAKGLGASLIPLDAVHAPLVAAAAYLGGMLSILSRLQAFSRLRDFDPMFLFLNALSKPFIGAVFGLFAYAAVKSGLVPLDQTVIDMQSLYSLWALGFLAGFSERFTNDLVSRGEGLAAPKKS